MAAPYPLLDIDFQNPPPDVRDEVPCPMLGVDPVEAELTPRVKYVLTRIDGMTSLGDLLSSIPLPPRLLIEALLLLRAEGLIGFAPEFDAKYLQPRPPTRTSIPPSTTPVAPPVAGVPSVAASAPVTPPAAAAPAAAGEPTPATGARVSVPTPMSVSPVQITIAPGSRAPAADGPGARSATFSVPPPTGEAPAGRPGTGKAAALPTETLTSERKGEIGLRPLARLGRHLLAARYSGVVTLRRGKVTKRLLVATGQPVHAESDDPNEELGVLMHKREKLDDKAFADYQARRKSGKEPLAALLELGVVTPPDAARAERWRAQAVLYDALLWRDGTFEIGEPGQVPADTGGYDLGFATLVLKAWREAPFDDKRKKFYEEHRNWYLLPGTITEDTLGKMKLNPKEERLLAALREQARRVRDIFEITSLFITETYKFIDGLLAMGLAELSEKNPTETGPIDPKELPELLQTMEAGNHFDRLGAHPISTDQDIVDSHQRMLARFLPQHYSNLRPQTREILDTIVKLIEEAYQQLKDGTRRKQYRQEQYDRPRLEYFADIQFRKGEIFLFWRDDPKTAFSIFESSYEMCPDIPLYAASYALTVVRTFPGDRRRWAEARALLDRILGRAGLAPKVTVIAAAAVREMGDLERSEQLCRTALQTSGNAPEIAQMIEQLRKRGKPGDKG